MHSVLLFVLCLCIQAFPAAADHPYNPHDHTSNPFFEGWFVRITSNSSSGPTSLAFGIGHLPDQQPSDPSAACFLIVGPDTQLASPAHLKRADSPAAEQFRNLSSNSAPSAPDSGSNPTPWTFVHYFSSLEVHPSKQQALCVDCPAFVAAGSNQGGSCRLEVTGDLVSIEAEVPGAFKLSASNDPASAAITPWGDSRSSSPEGWLPSRLLKLHWYVYSMATPIAYSLTLLDISSSTHNAQQAEHEQQQQQQQLSSEKQQRRRSMDWETHYRQQRTQAGAALQYSGTGFAHMEKNWGDAFPEQWVWAQGVSRDGKASFVLAGGSLPIKCKTLTKLLTAVLSKDNPTNIPLMSRAAAVPSNPAQNSPTHSNEALAFALSFHSPTLNLTVDPFHPGWVTSFEPCGCCSSLAIKITGWSYEVVLSVLAAASSFAGLPCPTEDGFRFASDESFTATAHVRVYGPALPARQQPWDGHAGDKRSPGQQRLLLSAAVFEGAALEFGGSLRCTGRSRQRALDESGWPMAATAAV